MKTLLIRSRWTLVLSLAVIGAVLAPANLPAEIQFRVSFKVILGPNGEWPNNSNTIGSTGVNLNSEQDVRDNIAFTNDLLERRGYPIRISLKDDTIYTVSGQSNPWYTIQARNGDNKNDLEDAATANAAAEATWSWHDNYVNVYLNDSRSGVCSRGTSRHTIFIGAGAYDELLLHELGHFFGLPHTHDGDGDGDLNDWIDGDGFSETLPDDADADAADINAQYPAETQATRDNLIFNVMSYHQPQDIFVWDQIQRMIEVANGDRDPEASGEGFFVRSDGNDANDGKTYDDRVQTLQRAVDLSTSSNDVILIRGNQNVANGTVFSKPHLWTKWRSSSILIE